MKKPRFLPTLTAGLFTLTAGALPLLTTLTLAPAAARAAEEAAGEVSFDFFYNNLGDNGDWYNTPDFGYVFQPYIAYKNDQWRPYTDGYWAQTDQGWTWVSYEDFGWACYHYGRWSQLENVGWVWVPGYEWGPGWVSWRTSDDYIGWAPLPPKSTQRVAATTVERTGGAEVVTEDAPRPSGDKVYQGRVLRPEDVEDDYDTGYNAGVDVQYDIGPGQYSFVPVQSFGAPYLAEAVVPVAQNVVIIENTNNVTNIVYRRGPRDNRLIYCGGPDYSYVSQRVERPIPRLLLERRTDVTAERGNLRADRFNTVRDNRLELFAPLVSRQAVNFNQVRPTRIKETLDRPQVIHGWRSAQQQDPRLVERLRERFQQQARQAPPARQVAANFVTPEAFRAQPPPSIQEQQRQHQPPPPRTAEGNRLGNNGQPGIAPANQPPVVPPPGVSARPPQGPPTVNPTNPAVRPAPGPGGRNLNDAERQARRDERQRELEQRQGNRPPQVPPGNAPATPPNVVNPGNPPAPAPATPTPERPKRNAEERDVYRASKQAARPGQTPPENAGGDPTANKPPSQPFQAPPANPERPVRRPEREREKPAAPRPNQETPPGPPRNPEAERAPRVREQPAPQPQQQEKAAEQARAAQEQRRAERRAEQPAPAQAQAREVQQQQRQAQAQQQREAQAQQQREAAAQRPPAEQPRRAGPPEQPRPEQPRRQEAQRPPQQQPQAPGQPGKNPDEERRKRGDRDQQ